MWDILQLRIYEGMKDIDGSVHVDSDSTDERQERRSRKADIQARHARSRHGGVFADLNHPPGNGSGSCAASSGVLGGKYPNCFTFNRDMLAVLQLQVLSQ